MNLIDLGILLLVVGAVASGWRRGFAWVGLSFTGLVIGVLIGSAIATPIARHFASHNAGTQGLIGTMVFLGCIAVCQGVGTVFGYRARRLALGTSVAGFDSGMGAALAAVGILASSWYIGLLVSRSSSRILGGEINGSAILRTIDRVFPNPPGFLNSLGQVLSNPNFPDPFSHIGENNLSPVQLPPSISTAGVKHTVDVTAKVLSLGCGLEAGSAWPIGNDHYVTNAHVVAGGQSVTIELGSRHLDATVVLYDPETDVAVLHVPGVHVPALPMGGDPARGAVGAVVGYPGGGVEQAVPAAIRGVEDADSRDIYGGSAGPRRIEVLQADVIPGNSGGPLVSLDGTVIGMVFAASTTEDNVGYALSMTAVGPDIAAGRNATAAVSTQDCTA